MNILENNNRHKIKKLDITEKTVQDAWSLSIVAEEAQFWGDWYW